MRPGRIGSLRAQLTAVVASSAIAFALLIGTNAWLGARVERQLTAIQANYLPKIDLRPALVIEFERIQRAFEDAVTSHDPDMLAAANEPTSAFLHRLNAAGGAIPTEDARVLRDALEKYRSGAESVSRRLIAGESGEEVVDAMMEMQITQKSFLDLLRTTTDLDPSDLGAAFAATRRAERAAASYRLGLSVACFVAVLALSLGISRRLVASVENLTTGFRRFGEGDFGTPVRVASHDELGELTIRANEMASRLDRLRAERAEAEAMFRGVLESAPDAMVVVDASARIVLVSAETEKLFGYSRDELLGELLRLVLPEPSQDRGTELAPDSGTERVGRRKNGTELPVEVRVSPIDTQHGGLAVNAIRDVTARKRAEEALTMSNRELEAFSYSVAHDLRAPLRSIQGFSVALLEDCADDLGEDGKDHLRRVMASADRMGQLIDSLLALSRVSRAGITTTTVNLSHLADSVVAQLRAGEPNRLVEMVTSAEPIVARGDPALLRILLENLIGNAWKFTGKRERGRIEFGETRKSSERVYYVRDNGVGFDMSFVGKLFAPFQRLHTTEDFPGTGVGLATVQRIVRRHGGRIWAEAHVDQGATFYFTLPNQEEGALS